MQRLSWEGKMALSQAEYERRAKTLRESGDIYDQYHLTKDLPDNLRSGPVSNKENTPNNGNIGAPNYQTGKE